MNSSNDSTSDFKGKRVGGAALIGWSLEIAFTLAAIANVDSDLISDETRKRLSKYLRAYILLEPAVVTIDLNLRFLGADPRSSNSSLSPNSSLYIPYNLLLRLRRRDNF
ncbi:hypothetical protein F5050DRAFT_521476 [Lentinula boryana]|uniref:Uncharacterized protein n=1 Tax=Lentinula boryana TaxID=40481 RepID=A0ABQ8Q798_9AGAR|nr:hypothetical protein F5050DRAFT_521476 [Lentinula boryana]